MTIRKFPKELNGGFPVHRRLWLLAIASQPVEPNALNAVTPARAAQEWLERRAEDRFPVALPAAIGLAGQQYSARLINLAHSGALIETSAPLHPHTIVTLHCGTIVVRAAMVWTKGNHIGVKFNAPLTDAQVIEQVARTFALEFRRARTLQA